jgi:hypothetical protein
MLVNRFTCLLQGSGSSASPPQFATERWELLGPDATHHSVWPVYVAADICIII